LPASGSGSPARNDITISGGDRNAPGLVHIASIDWDWWWARQQQLTVRLARTRKALFVEQMLSLDAIVRRRRIFRHVSHNVWVLSPYKLLPFESKNGHFYELNRFLFALQVRLACWFLWIRNPVLMYTTYDDHGLPHRLSHRLVIYDCLDRHEHFPWATGEEPALERRLLGLSDVVIASSPELVEKLRGLGVDAALVKNAADTSFFTRTRGPGRIHPAIRNIPKPRIGFMGYVADHLDLDLMAYLAEQRPLWSLVLAGRRGVRDHPLFHRANVFYIGEIPYDELPDLLRGIDVCLVPFIVNPLTDAADTIKLYEYLAAGKPVVSTGISQARQFSRFVSVARSRQQFVDAVQEYLTGGSALPLTELDEILRESDWDVRSLQLEELIRRALALADERTASHAKLS